jgi:Domain of unknown function (DUF5134)
MIPAWLLDICAGLMLVVAAVSAGRLVLARSWQRGSATADIDVAHLLMALAMAGTLAPGLAVVPSVAWRVIFAMMTAWFAERVVFDARAHGIRALAGGHCAPHLMHSAAMLYMFLALVPPARGDGAQMPGMGGYGSGLPGLRYPTLALVFALVLIGYAVWDLDQLSSRRHSFAATVARVPSGGVLGAALAGMSAMPGAEAAAFTGSATPGPATSGSPASVSASAASVSAASVSAASVSAASASPADADTATDPPSRPAAAADAGVRSGLREILLSPGTTVGCRIVMGLTMAFMLLIMI